MSGPDLSLRLGRALGRHDVQPSERATVVDAAREADLWDDLPADIQALIEEIESRPGGVPPHIEKLESEAKDSGADGAATE